MKKLIVLMALVMGLGVEVMAAGGPGPRGFHGGGRPRTTVVIGGGFSPFYAPFGYSWGYGYGYPYGYGMPYRPSKLDMQIAEIKSDYADRITSVKMDRSLTGKERRAMVKQFKTERGEAIMKARMNYYKS